MKIPKFKVGDKVRVLRSSTGKEHDLWQCWWMPSMNLVIGKVMTIEHVNLNGNMRNNNFYPEYRFKEVGMNFPEFVLELENEIRVGEQLLFNFMKQEE